MRQQQPFQINAPRLSLGLAASVHRFASTCGLELRVSVWRLAKLTILCASLIGIAGCNSFGNSRLVKELQSENDRLLSEFRAQRDRAAELEKTNQLQASRLAESEKLLARLSQGGGAGRLSSLPHGGLTSPAVNSPGLGSVNSNLTAPSASPPPGSAGELRWQPRPHGP